MKKIILFPFIVVLLLVISPFCLIDYINNNDKPLALFLAIDLITWYIE